MSPTDHELLQRYAHQGPDAQPAFTAIVERHLNLVYSVARRQLGASHLAEDVSQAVFMELARHADRLPSDLSLVAWLHVVSRRKALDAIRGEARRRAREQTAAAFAEMKITSSPPQWSTIEPLLDEAVESLPPADRTAILLRFFENKSLREIGAALGASEDAAQKRIGRAVDRLRDFLGRRGVTVTAAGLVTELSAHAIQLAPTALGGSIAASVGSLAAGTGLTGILAMSTLQKTVMTTALVLVAGGAVFQAQRLFAQRDEIARLRSTTDQLARETGRLRQGKESVPPAAAAPVAEPIVSAPVDPALAQEAVLWMSRLKGLKRVAAEHPEWTVPEMALLPENVWFEHAQRQMHDPDPTFTRIESLMHLRALGKMRLAEVLMVSANEYLKSHHNQLPPTMRDLLPFIRNPDVTPEMLDRYAIRYRGSYADVPADKRAATFVEITSPDEERDQRLFAGPGGASVPSFRDLQDDVSHALRSFAATRNGAKPASPGELLPYFNPPLSPARQIKFIEKAGSLLPPP